jgi:uncharacterized protein (DUF2252 family)
VTVRSSGHTVLASADSDVYASLRKRPSSRAERYAMGRALRREVPRKSLAGWRASADRPDPVQLIMESHQGRLDWLIPVRVARMVISPYGFLRGTAIVSRRRADSRTESPPGLWRLARQLASASPGAMVIDLNDFDEAHPGSWEWDLRRLAASIWVAGRENGSSENQCRSSVLASVAAYRSEVQFLAEQPLLMRSYNRLDVGRLHETANEKSLRDEIERSAKRARSRTSDRALPRFTVERDGQRHIVEDPPLITRLTDQEYEAVAEALDDYLHTLAPHWRRALGGYTLIDVAHKVVGVGSVGLRAYVALLEGSSPDDVVFLQLKQARRSVLARYVHGDSAWHAHRGQRVVSTSKRCRPLRPAARLSTIRKLQYSVRQFRTAMKGPSRRTDRWAALTDYAGIVGHLLAGSRSNERSFRMITATQGH